MIKIQKEIVIYSIQKSYSTLYHLTFLLLFIIPIKAESFVSPTKITLEKHLIVKLKIIPVSNLDKKSHQLQQLALKSNLPNDDEEIIKKIKPQPSQQENKQNQKALSNLKLKIIYKPKIIPSQTINRRQNIWDEVEVKTTAIYRNTKDIEHFQNLFFGLTEIKYSKKNNEIELGVAYQNTADNNLFINNLAFSQEHENIDLKIGKFVSKIGVMDFLSTINTLNNTRIEHYNEPNVNVRYIPAWMAKADIYPDDNSTLNIYVKAYDQANNILLNKSTQFGLNSVLPFFITHSAKNDSLGLISKKVLLPVYERNAKPIISTYLQDKMPNEKPSIDNTSLFLNYSITDNDYTVGTLYTNAYSSLPIVTFDADLVASVDNIIDTNGKEIHVENYLSKPNNEPIKLIESFRYNQMSLYYESFIGQLGYRGEVSYRDKFSLLNKTSGMTTISLGVDQQSSFYTNFELQYSKFEHLAHDVYQMIWLVQSETINVNSWKIHMQNILTYAVYDVNDILANYLAIRFLYDNFEVSTEYLMHSKQEYTSNTFAIKAKITF